MCIRDRLEVERRYYVYLVGGREVCLVVAGYLVVVDCGDVGDFIGCKKESKELSYAKV